MRRYSMSCDAPFPRWGVLTGATEQGGLGAVRLATEVTKERLRHCQAMATSPTIGGNVIVLALERSAQRRVGSRGSPSTYCRRIRFNYSSHLARRRPRAPICSASFDAQVTYSG